MREHLGEAKAVVTALGLLSWFERELSVSVAGQQSQCQVQKLFQKFNRSPSSFALCVQRSMKFCMWLPLNFLFFSHCHTSLKSQYDQDPSSHTLCWYYLLLGPIEKVMENGDLLTGLLLSHWRGWGARLFVSGHLPWLLSDHLGKYFPFKAQGCFRHGQSQLLSLLAVVSGSLCGVKGSGQVGHLQQVEVRMGQMIYLLYLYLYLSEPWC